MMIKGTVRSSNCIVLWYARGQSKETYEKKCNKLITRKKGYEKSEVDALFKCFTSLQMKKGSLLTILKHLYRRHWNIYLKPRKQTIR